MQFAIRCDLARGCCEVIGWRATMGSSLAVSTGLGVSVLAGLITGVCYVVAYGVHKKKRKNRRTKGKCTVCGDDFRSIDRILGGDDGVTCRKCGGRACRRKCSTLNEARNDWTCQDCLLKPTRGGWYNAIIDAIRLDKIVYTTVKMHSEPLNEIDEDLEAAQTKSREQVQDFIEKLVNTMLGQNVDDASVTKLYNDKHYDGIFRKYHRDLSEVLTSLGTSLHSSISNLPLEGESPCTAHAALKQLIENVLKEAVKLPNLQNTQNPSSFSQDLVNRTYEDLLATAILNKVVTNCQNALPSSSSAASVSSRISNTSRTKDEKEYFFGEETLEDKWKTADPETTSMSSLESWIHSDSSFGSRKYVDKVTLTIKQDIEEVSQSEDSDNEQDDTEYLRAKSSLLDEEPNWFLQKRQFQGTHSPVPVPMLIPDPTTDAKVLIGDKEADETSDLSDVGSEYGDTEPVQGRPSLLLDSKTVIGGKNLLQGGEEDSESSADSGVKVHPLDEDRSGYDEQIFVSKADITVDDDNVEDTSLLSIYSNTEKEAEYTEKYASLPRTILKTPTPPLRQSLHKHPTQETQSNSVNNRCQLDSSDDEMEEQFSGIYSKREKEKWKHAVEMKNNPYSKEKLEKRITRSHSAVSSLFGPDYYARQASSPAGKRLKSPEAQEHLGFPAYDEEIIGDILIENSDPKKLKIPEQFQKAEETNPNVHRAVPVIVHQEADRIEPEIKPSLNRPPDVPETSSIVSEMTSDSDLSYVNFYDVENSQVYKTSKGKPDENYNTTTVPDKNLERPKYLKLKSTVPTRMVQKVDHKQLRRHKSETDLSNDSFDAPATVISRKKDNTLISRIYMDPQVRNFAMNSRHELPIDSQPAATFRSLSSLNEIMVRSNTSEDLPTLSRTRNNTTTSSKEDLLNSLDSNQAKNYEIKSARMSLSSEEDILSDRSPSLNATRKFSRHSIYSSSDDLLSIEENDRPQKKKDNTLISKIYQQTNVRNYAMSNRDFILGEDSNMRKPTSSDDDVFSDKPTPLPRNLSNTEKFLEKLKSIDQSTPTIQKTVEVMKATEDIEENPDPEIEEIAKRKIVHNFLFKFHQSQPKLVMRKKSSAESQEVAGSDEEITVSVRDLKKRFENNQN